MPMKRSLSDYALAPLPPRAPVELEITDVTRLICVLDNGLPVEFDLGKDDSYMEDDQRLTISIGSRTIHIFLARVLYFETRPEQRKRAVAPK